MGYNSGENMVREMQLDISEELLANEEFAEILEKLTAQIGHYENEYVERNSFEFDELVAEATSDDVDDVMAQVDNVLLDAQHRLRLFGEEILIEDLIQAMRHIEPRR